MKRIFLLGLAIAIIAVTAAARAFDASFDAQNYAKQLERPLYQQVDPRFQAALAYKALSGAPEVIRMFLRDPDRKPLNLCAPLPETCGTDGRYTTWAGHVGIRLSVAWVNRNGATIAGH